MTGKHESQAPSGVATRADMKQDAPEHSTGDKPVHLTGPGGTKVTADPAIADDVKELGFS